MARRPHSKWTGALRFIGDPAAVAAAARAAHLPVRANAAPAPRMAHCGLCGWEGETVALYCIECGGRLTPEKT